jgi:deoxyribodipyrimidine photolyase-like uncharacterized protein
MRCVGEAVRQVVATGHTHHIQRLMVLGSFALLAGVEPGAVNDWFLERRRRSGYWRARRESKGHVPTLD